MWENNRETSKKKEINCLTAGNQPRSIEWRRKNEKNINIKDLEIWF